MTTFMKRSVCFCLSKEIKDLSLRIFDNHEQFSIIIAECEMNFISIFLFYISYFFK